MLSIRLSEALLNGLPVDDIPDSLEVLSLAVLVLEAVSSQSLLSSVQWKKLTSRHAPRRQCREGGRTGPRQGPGSRPVLVNETKGGLIWTYSIGADANLASAFILDEPSPATSLDAR